MNNNGQPRIGVFICHCGANIASKVNVFEVAEFASTLDNVVVAREYKFMCSDPGQELIKDHIKKYELNRVVVASCSPLMHEPTFRNVTNEGGLNPFYFQMANIREHVSWVTKDPEKATKKAKSLISAAVKRVALHDPLAKKEVPVRPEVLIVGGGIAGISAALTYANSGKKVYLVEKEPSIGGHMSMLDKTFPTLDCSACILTPKMSEVGKHPNIELLTWSEVEEISGFVGSFKVRIKKKARYVDTDKCNGCGACWENCPTTITPSERIIKKGDIIIKTIKKEN
ncbi:MAG: CoB--CoM heterodisulfide reductase iron-sulfur subunit A family protein [Candidatus Aminicenantes bacterium]|nr:CoB--CoM heterodisulfide reductase iron-sulfur subunit A family protein [Candidatus Aminicenantes bacterium]